MNLKRKLVIAWRSRRVTAYALDLLGTSYQALPERRVGNGSRVTVFASARLLRLGRGLIAIAALVLFGNFAAPAIAQPLLGKVVGVADGDTITVLDVQKRQHKIRLSGIDAPEGGQAFGNRSKQTLSDCAFGKQASVEGDKTDRYGRTIAKVLVNGIDCNFRQVELGMAWHFKKYARERPAAESKAYAAAEDAARAAKLGLWSDIHAMPPWDWRAGGQQAAAEAKESSGECSCATEKVCTGKRGANYCLTPSGSKKYLR